jgi:hypothetical protein
MLAVIHEDLTVIRFHPIFRKELTVDASWDDARVDAIRGVTRRLPHADSATTRQRRIRRGTDPKMDDSAGLAWFRPCRPGTAMLFRVRSTL